MNSASVFAGTAGFRNMKKVNLPTKLIGVKSVRGSYGGLRCMVGTADIGLFIRP
jgi:hypothetical protein